MLWCAKCDDQVVNPVRDAHKPRLMSVPASTLETLEPARAAQALGDRSLRA